MRTRGVWLSLSLALSMILSAAAASSQPLPPNWCGPFDVPPDPGQAASPPPAACPVPSAGGSGSGPGGAQTEAQPQPQGPKPCMPPCSGSPCYVGTGIYADAATDLVLRTNGLPLVSRRLYDSSRLIDGPLGYGWISNLATRLYSTTYLFAAPSTYQTEATVTMPTGLQYRFKQTGSSFSPPAGRRDVLVKNVDGTFDLTFEFTRSVFHFGSDGSLVSMQDDYGNTLTVTYDGSARIQQVADASGSGRYLTISWGADGRISAVQDSSGRIVQYSYTPQGNLQTVTDSANRVTTYSYTAGRFIPLLSKVKDNWNRVITDITYDAQDRVHTYTERGETYTYTYAYTGNPNLTQKIDSQGNFWIFTWTAGGYITDKQTVGAGFTSFTEHTSVNADGTIASQTDQVGVVTQNAYNAGGLTSSVTRDASGSNAVRFDYVYDTNFPEKVISITPKVPATGVVNPNWQAWRYDYWPAGSAAPGALNHVYRVRSDGVTLDTLATYTYDSHGRVTRVTSATGGATDYVYDAQGNLQTVTAPANNDAGTRPVTIYAYDSLGRVTSVTDPLNHATSYTYDALNRVTSVTLPKPSTSSTLTFTTTYSYDNFDSPSGLVFVNVTDPNSKITKQGYDQFGQLARSVDAANNTTSYAYTRGLMTSITDANGNATSYSYDGAARLTGTTFPDGAYETYRYFADGLLFEKRDRNNNFIDYYYDGLKRLTSRVYGPNGVGFTYQGQRLAQVVDGTVPVTETHTLTYDSSYRLQSETQAGRGTITRTYNVDDTITTTTVQSGPTTTYAYYADGSLNTIQWSPVSAQFKYMYTLPGQYQSITFPNGQTRNFSYDDQGRLTQLSNLTSGGGNLATYAYGYDLNYTTGQYTMLGQRVSMTATVPSQGLNNHSTTYEFDPLYELNKVTYPNVAPFNGEVDSWTYDAIGNRLTNTVNGTTANYTYQKIGANPNNWQRLISDGSNSSTYNANGSTATRNGPGGNFTFAWTAGNSWDNRLYGISGATTASYVYDYQGRRASKTVGSATTYFYDGLNLVREAGASAADYLFGPGIDEPLATSRGGQVYYYETDALGSVAAVTNPSGAVQNTYLYDAWGQVKQQTGSLANPFTYTARETGEAGLNFYRARYYQPSTGRFLQEDPLLDSVLSRDQMLPADINGIYSYGGNDPVERIDPLGLKDCGPVPKPTGKCAADCLTMLRYERCVLKSPGFPLPNLGGGASAVIVPSMAAAIQQYRCCMRDCINEVCPMPGGKGYRAPCRMNGPPPIELYPPGRPPTPTPIPHS